MELRHLRYFLAVAEELNFSRAALRLHIAQPPLSQQIRQLEEELGLQLLERGSRPLRLTEAGRFFKTEATTLIAQLEQAIAGTRRIGRGEVGWIGIGYVGSAMNLLIPPVLRRFHAEHPGVEVLLYEMLPFEQSAALLDRRVHVSFVRHSTDPAELIEESLYEEPISIALPSDHRWAGRSEIAIAELVDEPIVLYGGRMNRGVDSGFLMSLFRAAGFEPKVAVGVGHAPRAGVSFVRAAAPSPSIPMKIAYRAIERSPVVLAFLKITREVAAALPAWR